MPKSKSADTALKIFISSIKGWDGKSPSMQELFVDAAAHCAEIEKMRHDGSAFVDDFSLMTGYPTSWIRIWMCGPCRKRKGEDSDPPPPNDHLAKDIVEMLRVFLSAKLKPDGYHPH